MHSSREVLETSYIHVHGLARVEQVPILSDLTEDEDMCHTFESDGLLKTSRLVMMSE